MKTNYLNAKQQMAALTLGVACLFSIAWITPAEKRNNNKEIAKINFNAAQFKGNNKPKIYLDTTKKRKIKIVTVDANGKKTEYNSVKEMPDSIKNDFLNDNLSFGNSLMLNLDSTNLHLKIDTARFALMNKRFASAEFRAQMASVQKNALKLAKTYNSPEAQAKWKKFGEAVAKEYSSPEAQAKWKKFGEEVAKEYSSPEAQAKWKKFGEDVAKEYSSPEAQERYKKIAEDALAIASISDYKSTVNEIKFQALSAKDFKNKSAYTRSVADSAFKAKRQVYGLKSGKNNYVYIDGDNELRQNQEYKKLKEKFDKEVKELKEKLEKTERKEKTEKPEKPEL
ncbi:hypothetical protein [Pedobacter mucosus]|uniref:hypothetical protein n=1 Tax=Pedobacter mucosus TaxID=2895286 RepID=UPI001EE40A00|nr:hypothetical protein [Pedobacter mucosus]UKT62468.1 hypothetical protein LOK61_11945 [Pedobacter mucosus]